MKNELPQRIPYSELTGPHRYFSSAMEFPAIAASVVKKKIEGERLNSHQAQKILRQSLEVLQSELLVACDSGKIHGKIGEGFEAAVFDFTIPHQQNHWILKCGLPTRLTPGLYSPQSTEYASAMKWNRKMLEEIFSEKMPHLLPSPYYILSPDELAMQTTTQITPYLEQFQDLTDQQITNLIIERFTFDKLCQKLFSTKKIIPDLIGEKNLMIANVADQPHLVLIDMGLQNAYAPIPLLNSLALPAHKVSLIRDLISLRRERKCQ